MSSYQVAVVPNEAAPAAGTAIVRISGLKSWPENATVRLLPIDDAAVPPNSIGWPWDPIKPQQIKVTDTGIDIVLGADIVASPRLLPGTPLTIKIGAANVEVESRWPAVVPAMRRRAGVVAMTATQLLAAKAERDQEKKLAAERRTELANSAIRSAREATASASTTDHTPGTTETPQLARLIPMRRQEAVEGSVRATAEPTTGSMGQLARLGAAPAANVIPMPQPPPLVVRNSDGTLRGFLAGLAIMGAAAMLAISIGSPPLFSGSQSTLAASASSANQIAAVDLKQIFKDISAAGPQSPRNKSAANVDVATALSLADHSLRGQRTQAETEEAEFWLRRALASSMGGQDIGWALTQLGTIYATAGTPNHSYVKAHALWELATAQGDPVAHCFLGALYEHGLGVAKDKKAARDHYMTADSLGACRSAKAAAARLSE